MTHTLMIACIMLLCLAVIIAALVQLTRRDTRKKKMAMEEGLDIIANDKNLSFDKKEVFRNRLIAMDTKKELLVYVRLKDDKVEADVVDMRQMNSCEVMQINTKQKEMNIKEQKTRHEHITAVQLQFKGAHGVAFNIVFYNEIEDGAAEMQEYTQKAVAWRDIIGSIRETPVRV